MIDQEEKDDRTLTFPKLMLILGCTILLELAIVLTLVYIL